MYYLNVPWKTSLEVIKRRGLPLVLILVALAPIVTPIHGEPPEIRFIRGRVLDAALGFDRKRPHMVRYHFESFARAAEITRDIRYFTVLERALISKQHRLERPRDRSKFRIRLAFAYNRAGFSAKARAHIGLIVKANGSKPHKDGVWRLHACVDAYRRLGHRTEALRLLRILVKHVRSLKAAGEYVSLDRYISRLFVQLGKPGEARALNVKALEDWKKLVPDLRALSYGLLQWRMEYLDINTVRRFLRWTRPAVLELRGRYGPGAQWGYVEMILDLADRTASIEEEGRLLREALAVSLANSRRPYFGLSIARVMKSARSTRARRAAMEIARRIEERASRTSSGDRRAVYLFELVRLYAQFRMASHFDRNFGWFFSGRNTSKYASEALFKYFTRDALAFSPERADAYLKKLEAHTETYADEEEKDNARGYLARAYIRHGMEARSFAFIERALGLVRRVGEHRERMELLAHCADVLISLGQKKQAAVLLERVEEIARERRGRRRAYHMPKGLRRAALARMRLGEPRIALEDLKMIYFFGERLPAMIDVWELHAKQTSRANP